MSKRCGNCRWWDNEPYLEVRDSPAGGKGQYGDCMAPVPLLFGRVYESGQDCMRAGTDAEKCQCYEEKSISGIKRLLARCDPCMLPESYKAYKALSQELATALEFMMSRMACDNCSTTLEEVEQGHCRHCSQAWHRKPYDAAVAVLAKAAAQRKWGRLWGCRKRSRRSYRII
jgi:hypothetical protein